jgi:hypothetical protein
MHATYLWLAQTRERGQHGAVSGAVARPRHLMAQDCQLVTEHGDLDVLLVGGRAEP